MTGPVVLDGGTATELQRAGVSLGPPLWSASALLTEEHRRVLRSVHSGFLAAGADVLTANTFRCNARAAHAAGLDRAGWAWLVHAALGVAIAARADVGATAPIAGSLAPIGDCYRPELVPPDDELRAEHGWLATELVRAGVDLVLIETMNTLREARIALDAVLEAGGRAWVSFVCGPGARLLSGEPLAGAARGVEQAGAEATLVNCTQPVDTELCLRELREVCDGPVGAYPNLEDGGVATRPGAIDPSEFAEMLLRWHEDLGASLLGGCCGTTASHIAAARTAISRPRVAAGS